MNDPYHSMFDKITLSDQKKEQILQLNKKSQLSMKKGLYQRKYVVSAACIVVLIFLIFEPTRIYAQKIFYKIIRLVSVNEKTIELAPFEKVHLTIPDNMTEMILEGKLLQYKSYDTLANLEKDLNVDVLDFGNDYNVKNNQVNFQVQNHANGSINMLIDTETSKEEVPVSYTLYFSIDKNVPPEKLEYGEDYISYKIKDDNVVFDIEEKYNVIEKYRSSNLNTDVLILENIKKQTCEANEFEKILYHVIFVYDKVEYVLCFKTDLKSIKEAIEEMK